MELLLNTIMLEPNRWSGDRELSWPLIDLLEPIQVAGFQDLELWGYHVDRLAEAELENLHRAMVRRDQRALAVGAYPSFHLEGAEDEEQVERLERVVSASARLGARILKIFPGRVGSADADEAVWRRSVERMRRLAERLGREGMTLTLETHGGTLCDTLASTQRILRELEDAGDVGICFQPYAEHDTDQAIATFDALADDVLHLHLQNRVGEGRAVSLLAEGDWTDYERFLPHVRAAGFDGVMGIEFTAGITPPEGETFDLSTVLGNAMHDRRFVEAMWEV